MVAPVGTVPVSSPNSVKPPVGTVSNKPVSSVPPRISAADYWLNGVVGGTCVEDDIGTTKGSGCSTSSLEDQARRLQEQLEREMDARKQAELLEQYNLTLARIQDTKFYGVSFISSYRALKRVYASDTYKNAPAANKVSMNRGLKIGFGTGEVNGKWLKALANVMESFTNAKPRVYTATDVIPPLFRDLDGDGRLTSLDEDLLTLGVQPGAFVFNGSALTLAGGGTGTLAGLGGSGNTIRVGGGSPCVGSGCAGLAVAVLAGLLVGAVILSSQNPTKPAEAGDKPLVAPTTVAGSPNPEDPCKEKPGDNVIDSPQGRIIYRGGASPGNMSSQDINSIQTAVN